MWPIDLGQIPFKMAANVQSMCQYWKNFDLQELQVSEKFFKSVLSF